MRKYTLVDKATGDEFGAASRARSDQAIGPAILDMPSQPALGPGRLGKSQSDCNA